MKQILIGIGALLLIASSWFIYQSYNVNGGCIKEEVCASNNDEGICVEWKKGDTYICDVNEHQRYIIRSLVYGGSLFTSGVVVLCSGIILSKKKNNK